MCCGKKRDHWRQTRPETQSADEQPVAGLPESVVMEYTGHSRLTVRGGISGKQYEFARPFARLLIDGRDAPGLTAHPALRPAAESPRQA